MNDQHSCCVLQTTGSDSYAVLYASAENTHNTALFCMTYDQGYHRLPTRREDAVNTLTHVII